MSPGFDAHWQLRGDELREHLALVLDATRRRTFTLIEGLDDAALIQAHDEGVAIGWELGHIANFEERWLVSALGGGRVVPNSVDDVYDASQHDPEDRSRLPFLDTKSTRVYLSHVRSAALVQLVRTGFPREDPLLDLAFIYGVAVQHEHRHVEQILSHLKRQGLLQRADNTSADGAVRTPQSEVFIPGGPFAQGTDDEAWALDHERPGHVVEVPSFFIDAYPVSVADYAAFIEDGGYRRRELWSEEGFAFLSETGLCAPRYWDDARDGLPPDSPVQHVSFYEAEAWARWAKKRLPTEAEWEKAATWDAERGKRRYPWGDAPLDSSRAQLFHEGASPSYAPAPRHLFSAGRTPQGVGALLGGVWEWTSSELTAYPRFQPRPSPDVSTPFFGRGFRVLRGGSWATHPLAVRSTTRHWESPWRQDAFTGFRCVRDA